MTLYREHPAGRWLTALLLAAGLAVPAASQTDERETRPLPRGLTPAERILLRTYTAPKTGPGIPPPRAVRALAEFEELEGIVVRWAYGIDNLLLSQIVDAAQDEGKVWILVRPGTSDSGNIKTYLAGRGIPLTNLLFLSTPTNSVWCRDYGPWTVYDTMTDSMAIVDFRYNRPRPLDDVVPAFLAGLWGLPLYSTTQTPDSLVFTGGNFMVDGFGTGFASRLVNEENSQLTDVQIDSILWRFCGLRRFVKMQTLLYDEIHHIDMHMKLLDEETLLIGEYPPGQGDHDRIESTVAELRTLQNCYGRPYRIVRIPMPPDQSGQYPPNSDYLTYTNSLIVNRSVLVPVYGLPQDSAALQIYRAAMPGYAVYGFNSLNIIPANGAIHCITKEVGVREPVQIAHARREDAADTAAGYRMEARVSTRALVESVLVCWRPDSAGSFRHTAMIDSSGVFIGLLPPLPGGTTVQYYIAVKTATGRTVTKPLVGPAGPYHFTVFTVPQTLSVPLRDGWNLVSCPLLPGNDSATAIFPAGISSAYGYAAGAGYSVTGRLAPGSAYWLKFAGAQTALLTGAIIRSDTVDVAPGWNLIGPLARPLPAAQVVSIPAGIFTSPWYGFDGGYAPADTLSPGCGYWVRSSQAGRVVVQLP